MYYHGTSAVILFKSISPNNKTLFTFHACSQKDLHWHLVNNEKKNKTILDHGPRQYFTTEAMIYDQKQLTK